jgi:anti-anti-sigma factor
MNKQAGNSWLEVQQVGTTTVMKLPAGNLYHDEVIVLIGDAVNRWTETTDCRRFVLDFRAVDHISSEMLGVLLVAQKRIVDRGGRLLLCSLNGDLREVFATLRLDQVFTIVTGEPEALAETAAT